MQTWRLLFAASAVLFLTGVAVQFFLIGLALTQLGGNGDTSLHVNIGYWLPIFPLLSMILAWPARAGSRTVWLCVALFVDTFLQGVLPLARDSVTVIAALHPVNALVIVGLGLMVARRGIELVRATASAAEAAAPAPSSPHS